MTKKISASKLFGEEPVKRLESKLLAMKREEAAAVLGIGRTTIHRNAVVPHAKMPLAFYVEVCHKLSLNVYTAFPLSDPPGSHPGPELPSRHTCAIPIFGEVAAGIPSAPTDSVLLETELDHIDLPLEVWRLIYPGVDPRGLVALRIQGASMTPRHYPGDLIFVRQTRDKSLVHDGQSVIIELPGEGHTFKVWRDSGVLEGINPAFKPIPCPRGARLWGVYVCGTKTE